MTKVLKFPGNGLKRCEAVTVPELTQEQAGFIAELERVIGHYMAGWLRPEEVYQLVVGLITKGRNGKALD